MNLVLPYNNIHIKNFYYGKKMNNTIMTNSFFHNIYYSDENIQLNNVIIKVGLERCNIKEYFNKYTCIFDLHINRELISNLERIEKGILDNFTSNNHIYNSLQNEYKLTEHFKKGDIKFTSNLERIHNENNTVNVMIKISGIWYNNNSKGIIFKITN